MAAVSDELAADRARLARVQTELGQERVRLTILRQRLADARQRLGRQLLGSYESSKPDLVSVVLDAHGFNDLLERRPLLLGAVGLAVGAGVAAALPRVALEDAMAGSLGDLKASVRDGFIDAYARAANEAHAQGLTLEAASEALSAVGDKVADVAKGAVHDAKSSAG